MTTTSTTSEIRTSTREDVYAALDAESVFGPNGYETTSFGRAKVGMGMTYGRITTIWNMGDIAMIILDGTTTYQYGTRRPFGWSLMTVSLDTYENGAPRTLDRWTDAEIAESAAMREQA